MSVIKLEKQGSIAILTLTRPDMMNALGQEGDGAQVAAAPEMITLDAERRAKLIAFVSEGRMPDDVKARIIGQLEAEEVSSETVSRLEARMGS